MAKSKLPKPIAGHVIVENVLRKGFRMQKDSKVIPPSDYFIVDGGDTTFKKGQQILFGDAIRLTPLFKEKGMYVANSLGIIAFYE